MLKGLCLAFALTSSMFCLPVSAYQKEDELAVLKEQVKQLRAENQALRLQLGQGGASAKPSANQQTATETLTRVSKSAQSTQQAEQSCWITTSSSKRHNQGCRYYKTSKGRPCSKDEGIACKVCGG